MDQSISWNLPVKNLAHLICFLTSESRKSQKRFGCVALTFERRPLANFQSVHGFGFTTAFVRRVLLCLHGTSSFPTSSSQKQNNPAFIRFFVLLIADKCGLQHLEMISQSVLQKQSTQSLSNTSRKSKKNHKQKRTLSKFSRWEMGNHFQPPGIKLKCSLFKKGCFRAGGLWELPYNRDNRNPKELELHFWGEINTPRALNSFNSDGVRGEGRRKVHFKKATEVTWGWSSVEWCLFAKHPRKLPKLIRTGLCKNTHRMRLFVLSKPAPLPLGFSRQLKASQSLNPTGANLY